MSPTSMRLLNLSLRAATLISKFALVFLLARYLEPSEVGLYGLVYATIAYCLFVVGLEFYTFSMRELIAAPSSGRLCIIRNQVVFYCSTYLVFLPVFIGLFVGEWLPWYLIFWFYFLLVVEHLAQEMNRILVALSMQLEASIVLFMRSGVWGLIIIPLLWSGQDFRNLDFVFMAWLVGAFSSCVLGVFWIFPKIKGGDFSLVDWGWIRKGVKVALPMLVGALAVRGLFTFDRYVVEAIGSLDVLGAYVLYAGIASAVISFLDAGVVVFYYPRLVDAARSNNTLVFNESMKSLGLNIAVATSVLTILAFFSSVLVVEWLDKQIYRDNFYLLKWLLLASFIYGLSHYAHLGLYSQGKDSAIVNSQLAAMLTFAVLIVVFYGRLGVVVVPVALCSAFSVMFLWKNRAYKPLSFAILTKT